MENMIKKIILLTVLIFPLGVFAKEGIEIEKDSNMLSLSGGCFLGQARIDLYSKDDKKNPVYTAGAWCRNGKFEFEDDLSQRNIPDGEYLVVVDDKWGNTKSIKVEKPKPIIEEKKENIILKKEEEKGTFLDAFVAFQKSILDMSLRIEETAYPRIIKDSIIGVLNGILATSSKISDLMWSADNGFDVEVVGETDQSEALNESGFSNAEEIDTLDNKVERTVGEEGLRSNMEDRGIQGQE